jgi:hypothetical protein
MTGMYDASLDQSIAKFLGSDLTSLDEDGDKYQDVLTGPTKKKNLLSYTNYFWIEYTTTPN